MSVAMKALVFMLKVIQLPFRLLHPRDKIVMLTRQSDSPTLDFELLKDAILREDPNYEVVILAKRIRRGFSARLLYCFHILSQLYHIATSRTIVVDGYCMAVSLLPHKTSQHVIQIWHAVNIIKKFGYLAVDKPYGYSRDIIDGMRMHRNYDCVTSCGSVTSKILSDSLNISEEKIVLMGLPRIDYILSRHDSILASMVADYPELKGKQNILYAPTFRKGEQVDLDGVISAIDFSRYNLVVKLHPVDVAGFEYMNLPGVICDFKYLSYDWLWLCSKVITDYSGIGIESTLLDRPLYFYQYDFDEYNRKNGLIADLRNEPIAHYVTDSAETLARLIDEPYDFDALRAYREHYINVDISDCSGQMARWLLGIKVQSGENEHEYANSSR